jgi:hypothetical protein
MQSAPEWRAEMNMSSGSKVFDAALVIGAGALAVAAVLAGPKLLRAARPLVRVGLKRGLETYARAQAAAAELIEDAEDLLAEVQAELKHERHAKGDEQPPAPAREAGSAS